MKLVHQNISNNQLVINAFKTLCCLNQMDLVKYLAGTLNKDSALTTKEFVLHTIFPQEYIQILFVLIQTYFDIEFEERKRQINPN